MRDFISEPRLNSYKNTLKLKCPEQILRAYYWNKALSASIYPVVQSLEVTLRNALNEAVKAHHAGKFGGDDWWFEHLNVDIQDAKIAAMSPKNKERWLKPSGKRKKQSWSEQQVLSAIRDLEKEGRSPVYHDDVIGRLTFGYWVGMLGKDYEDVTHKTRLWPNLLPHVFPNTPHKPRRLKLEKSFRRVKELRNRFSHHEPVWKFYKEKPSGEPDYTQPVYGLNTSLELLSKAYEEMLMLIRWMSEDRYQSFIKSRLDVDFRKLCSHDGFYGFVYPSKIKNTAHEKGFCEVCENKPNRRCSWHHSKQSVLLGVRCQSTKHLNTFVGLGVIKYDDSDRQRRPAQTA